MQAFFGDEDYSLCFDFARCARRFDAARLLRLDAPVHHYRRRPMPRAEIGNAQHLLDELRGWVEIETPTTEPARVNALMDVAARELAEAGAALTRIPGRDGFGDNLIARINERSGVKPVFVAGHLDTVWSAGTLATMPFRVEGERAHGPGILDMKAGSFAAFYAVRAIARQRLATKRPIVLLLTPDEEVGSPTSRALIEREGGAAALALIPEAAGPGGVCVTARKGVGRFSLHVAGVGAHAGAAFQEGASAVLELARQILRLDAMVDLGRGVTLNVAPIAGGARPNVIATEATAEIDLRVMSVADGERLSEQILGLTAVDPRCRLTVTGGMNRPPFAESAGGLALYERARVLAAELGLTIGKQHRGGGSDGNFTASLVVPTLDGLGCPGAGPHASHEHILWRELEPRVALMASLLEELE
jgi:glutamate carboxypeptidase